ncbi:MAG: sensor histidine kinase [Phenylobacterium sp.]|uniref:sensor histidine kinase n=1 Tax=Phenylobacterium sp. TaxID=1871053 RepID=UPI00260109FC|nr:HAMP domain-containing sensor histidine kinase [Phenylobacterium sp.]MBI1196384.1 sensor histidine kinase [Phenylobacterium sp.]
MSHEADPPPPARPDARARLEAAAEEQKRSFLRMVSHELRTPLNSILGFSEILTAELYGPLGTPQYKEYAEIIHGSGQKLLKLVNQVLEIARLEGRTVDFDFRSEPLEPALDDVLAGLKADLAARKVTVAVDGRGDLPAVTADSRGLRSVLTQLIHNAIVFSPEGGTVRVAAARKGDAVEIRVHDDGEGVDPADLHRLMAPFEQGENALTRKSEGAGLGLPIADLTCRAMGGRLRLACEPGEGMTACVRLPAG